MVDKLPLNLAFIALLFVSFLLVSCSSAQYAVMEKFGIHKREILVDRVGEARESQQEAKEQFASALEEFSAVLNFQGGIQKSEEHAEKVRERIDKVENVAEALFDEWEDELKLYSSDNLRRSSASKLKETRSHYQKLMTAMRRAESRLEPVLTPLRDQVLYLKHNLNAQAIASLQGELGRVEGDVSSLIREMEAAIREADAFIVTLQK
jgi:SMC interacting uncharacterized protein involved in chromosome segregation